MPTGASPYWFGGKKSGGVEENIRVNQWGNQVRE